MMDIGSRLAYQALAASAMLYIGVCNATEDTISSAPESTSEAPVPAPLLDESALSQLHDLGWSIERAEDGSLLLYPPSDPIEKTLAAEPMESSRESFSIMDDKTIEELRSHGWEVDMATDGSVLLYPPAQTKESQPAEQATAGSQGEPMIAPVTEEAPVQVQPDQQVEAQRPAETETTELSETEMFDALEERGWMVEKTSDGSLLLYPPGREAEDESEAEAEAEAEAVTATEPDLAETPPGACTGTIPGIVGEGGIELPVDTWDEAHAVAQAWLDSIGGSDLTIGRIRHIYRVHIVSIIDAAPPHALRHQVAVRRSDGSVLVLD